MNTKGKLFDIYKNSLKKFSKGYGLGKHYPIKIILKKTHHVLKPQFTNVQGHKMFLDSKDSLGLSLNGIYEKFETELVKKMVTEGDVVVDVGAHIGYYTLIFAKCVGNGGIVFAFEPEPNNFSLLSKNIEINGYKNVNLEQLAISDFDGTCVLYTFNTSSGANRIYKPLEKNYKNSKPIQIKAISLDDYFTNRPENKIDLIKIDVEGAEFNVLKGMQNIMKKNINLKILLEFNPYFLENAGANPKHLIDFLQDRSFKINYLDEENNRMMEVDADFLLSNEIYKNHTVNLFCFR